MSAFFRRTRFVLFILAGAATGLIAARLGLSRGAVLGAILALGIMYLILEWRFDQPPPRARESRLRKNRPYRSPFAVRFDDVEIVVTLDGTRRESVKWSDLTTVGIRIDEEGFLPCAYWVLGGSPGGCYFPSEAEGCNELLTALQERLPDFDNEALVEATGLTTGGRVLWERERAST